MLNEVIVPNIEPDRILVVINQADFAMKGRHWLAAENQPDGHLAEFLQEQARSIQRRVQEATGVSMCQPVCYSAEFGFGVRHLLDQIVEQMPLTRRPCRWGA